MKNDRFVFPENELLIDQLKRRDLVFKKDPRLIYPWWPRPCHVKVLLLTDGSLNFGMGDFGLSTFVGILNDDQRNYVEFELTIAHRSGFVGTPETAVARSIPNFRFTDANHFTTAMYDQVWLFGFDASPVSMSNDELILLSTFMNEGGGVFATGDHGQLGRGLCGSVTRVRSMRRWDNSSGEVGMEDPRRNDTNRQGHDVGSQFNDQSDDVPQVIQPKLYSSRIHGFWRETYPHPVLCCPLGRITVMPDHPHEGECLQPSDLSRTYLDGTPEFPGGISPELIAFSSVPAGNTSGIKQPTQAHSFGSICAYDGHRANVGRVITDATWHHFVNVNLVGELGVPDSQIKGKGFLATASGQNHFRYIKHYYINIAVWISRKKNHQCFNSRSIWDLVFNHRVLEATMDNASIPFEKIAPSHLYAIGSHATDVLGKTASQCRRLKLLLDLFEVILPEFARQLDPWEPVTKPDIGPDFPLIDTNPITAMAIGAGLLAIHEKFKIDDFEKISRIDESISAVFEEGAKRGLDIARQSLNNQIKEYSRLQLVG